MQQVQYVHLHMHMYASGLHYLTQPTSCFIALGVRPGEVLHLATCSQEFRVMLRYFTYLRINKHSACYKCNMFASKHLKQVQQPSGVNGVLKHQANG